MCWMYKRILLKWTSMCQENHYAERMHWLWPPKGCLQQVLNWIFYQCWWNQMCFLSSRNIGMWKILDWKYLCQMFTRILRKRRRMWSYRECHSKLCLLWRRKYLPIMLSCFLSVVRQMCPCFSLELCNRWNSSRMFELLW